MVETLIVPPSTGHSAPIWPRSVNSFSMQPASRTTMSSTTGSMKPRNESSFGLGSMSSAVTRAASSVENGFVSSTGWISHSDWLTCDLRMLMAVRTHSPCSDQLRNMRTFDLPLRPWSRSAIASDDEGRFLGLDRKAFWTQPRASVMRLKRSHPSS
jgi:hypothetical protein